MKIKFNSPVILTYTLICTVVYLMSGGPNSGIMPMFTLMNETNFTNPLAIFRLFSHVAGHASFEHLMGNMTFILLLGPIIEERYGSQRTLLMILITGLLTAIANIVLFNTGLLGASGIVFMLIILVSITNVKNGEIPVTFILVAILFIGKEVLAGFGQDNVSNFAHIFGGLCGSVFGFSRK